MVYSRRGMTRVLLPLRPCNERAGTHHLFGPTTKTQLQGEAMELASEGRTAPMLLI